ncbi:MAG: hypothetical protein CMJ90_17580 [Planctomycetes bacterium]|nr:hypothetical protein [Planctomycetota bacterium]
MAFILHIRHDSMLILFYAVPFFLTFKTIYHISIQHIQKFEWMYFINNKLYFCSRMEYTVIMNKPKSIIEIKP